MANEIRTIFYIFVIVSYFVRQGDTFGEQNTNAGHFRPEVVFCSPLRRHGAWNTSEKIQSPKWSYLVCISSACSCLRMRISFGATTLRIPPEWYLRTRPEGVTHSPRKIYALPRRSYAFAPNGLRIRPEGVAHSPRRCYAFAPKVVVVSWSQPVCWLSAKIYRRSQGHVVNINTLNWRLL